MKRRKPTGKDTLNRTSSDVASKASRILRDPNASKDEKAIAASALSQARGSGSDSGEE